MSKENNDQYTASLATGSMLAEYRIERVLGQGGLSLSYLAYDTKVEKYVVIKENFPSAYAARELGGSRILATRETKYYQWAMNNFINEVHLLHSLDHPNIVKVHRAFEANDTAYIVMDYIEGESLAESINQQTRSEKSLRHLLLELLYTLDYLHEHNIIHYGITLHNIIINKAGRPVLIDFLTARHKSHEIAETIIMVPHYSPIETLSNKGNTGSWSDIYALGACLRALITGEHPTPCIERLGEDAPCKPLAHQQDRINYSKAFCATIDKAFQMRPADRWQSAKEWINALNSLQPTPEQPNKKSEHQQ